MWNYTQNAEVLEWRDSAPEIAFTQEGRLRRRAADGKGWHGRWHAGRRLGPVHLVLAKHGQLCLALLRDRAVRPEAQ